VFIDNYITTTTAAALKAAYWRLKPTPRAMAKRRAVARSGWAAVRGAPSDVAPLPHKVVEMDWERQS